MARTHLKTPPPTASSLDPNDQWSVADALTLYGVPHWGEGYFGINEEGHVVIHPDRSPERSIDLKRLVDQLAVRGIHAPVLVRFTDVLRDRIAGIAETFRRAIKENGYRGSYCGVYPIKVNQQRHVVEDVYDFGREQGFGLEAGSKPELLAVLALVGNRDVPIICNGFKDDEFIEMVVLAQKIGKHVIPVVEKFTELEAIARYAELHDVKPQIGIRVKLSTRGAGRWEESGGSRSKFGLFISEVLDALDYLKQRDLADCLKLLHFHLGSQITNIRNIKRAVNELARVYTSLKHAGAGLEYLDIGGGLGVDYDGSQTNHESSTNYSLEEYASDVVWRIKSVCDDAEIEHPTIISESGRAMVAHHAALIFNVLGVSRFDHFDIPETLTEADDEEDGIPQPIVDLFNAYRELALPNAIETYHDVTAAHEEANNLFNLGYLSIERRALAERLYWATCTRLLKFTEAMERVPDDLQNLHAQLCDTYFCNMSIFQSLPDSWAINQRFPIMPIHRLEERPVRRGILADITCDSDGKIDRFIDMEEDKRALELHPYTGDEYLIGAFLVGAYQEILGDLHNLLGDTHAVHVSLDENGEVDIDQVVLGDTVREVLGYVQFVPDELSGRIRRELERAVKRGVITLSESAQMMRFYENGINGYTYLESHED